MGSQDGTNYCDVCGGEMPGDDDRHALEGGRVCCSECWKRIQAAVLAESADARFNWLRDRLVIICLIGGAVIGAVSGRPGLMGALEGGVIGACLGFGFGLLIARPPKRMMGG